VLTGHLQPEPVKPTEHGQTRRAEDSVGHVEVFQKSGVRTSILGRPRPPHPAATPEPLPTPSFGKIQFDDSTLRADDPPTRPRLLPHRIMSCCTEDAHSIDCSGCLKIRRCVDEFASHVLPKPPHQRAMQPPDTQLRSPDREPAEPSNRNTPKHKSTDPHEGFRTRFKPTGQLFESPEVLYRSYAGYSP